MILSRNHIVYIVSTCVYKLGNGVEIVTVLVGRRIIFYFAVAFRNFDKCVFEIEYARSARSFFVCRRSQNSVRSGRYDQIVFVLVIIGVIAFKRKFDIRRNDLMRAEREA